MSAALMALPRLRFDDSNGDPLVGGKVYVYYGGTSTPADTWFDYQKITKNPNPIILDVRGEAAIYVDPYINYKVVIKDQNDTLVYTQDMIYGSSRAVSSQEEATQSAGYATAAAASASAANQSAAYLASYMGSVIMNITFPLDLGLVSDPTLYNQFDLGAV